MNESNISISAHPPLKMGSQHQSQTTKGHDPVLSSHKGLGTQELRSYTGTYK